MIKPVAILLMVLLLAFCASAQEEETPQTAVWHFENGLDGDAKTVGNLLNGPLIQAWKHYCEIHDALHDKQENVARRTSADIQAAAATQRYKDQQVVVKAAEAELESARARDDVQAALDAGSRFNLQKEKLKQWEAQELKNDRDLAQMREFVDDYQKKSSDAFDAVQRAAHWRAKIIFSIGQSRFTLRWPLKEDKAFFFNDSSYSRVVKVVAKETTIETMAFEYVKDSDVKNKFGDGLNMVTVMGHLIHVIIPTPSGFTASPNDDFSRREMYKLLGSASDTDQPAMMMPLPRKRGDAEQMRMVDTPIEAEYKAVADDGEKYGWLWKCLNDVGDVPPAILDKAEADAKAEVNRVLSVENAKMRRAKPLNQK